MEDRVSLCFDRVTALEDIVERAMNIFFDSFPDMNNELFLNIVHYWVKKITSFLKIVKTPYKLLKQLYQDS